MRVWCVRVRSAGGGGGGGVGVELAPKGALHHMTDSETGAAARLARLLSQDSTPDVEQVCVRAARCELKLQMNLSCSRGVTPAVIKSINFVGTE